MMASTPPLPFVDLNTATSRLNRDVNIMGVVTDMMPPRPSNGPDWMFSFSITDLTHDSLNGDGFKIRFFRPLESELPAIKGTGDVISIRGLGIKSWSGMTIGLSNRTTTWVVFPAASVPVSPPSSPAQLKHLKDLRSPTPASAEMKYAIALCNSRDRSAFTESTSTPASSSVGPSSSGAASAGKPSRDKFSLLKDLQVGTYSDLVGQVVKVYLAHNRVELYLTDYTTNPLLWLYEWGQDNDDESGRDGDMYNYAPRSSSTKKWPGPFGKMTLTVTLWPPHSYFAQESLKEHDFVHLRNTHIKWSKDSKIEGALHSDQRYPDRVDVTILKNNEADDRVKDVVRRKRDYTKKFEQQNKAFVAEARGLKRKDVAEGNPLSKTAQKKRRKLERERLAKLKASGADSAEDKENQEATNPKLNSFPAQPPRESMNKNVNCANHLITPRSVSDIISLDRYTNKTPADSTYTLPFQNIKSRSTVRIIDFFPSNLADFAVPLPKASEYDILSDTGSNGSEGNSSEANSEDDSGAENERQWEWRFALVLEDATGPTNVGKATMTAYVAGQDAECLLKLDAQNLRKSPTALAELRERLFLLWGDLEERKSRQALTPKEINGNAKATGKHERPKSKAFQCCLKEYGVKVQVDKASSRNGDEMEEDNDTAEKQNIEEKDWVWERRWRIFGTTII